MLVLTRRVGESILIELPSGELIEVTMLDVKGSQVRIGTDAPDDITIIREELRDVDSVNSKRKLAGTDSGVTPAGKRAQ